MTAAIALLALVGAGCGEGGATDPTADPPAASIDLVGRTEAGAILVRSEDRGEHWTVMRRTSEGGWSALTFVDRDHGWLVGSEILHTADGGAHWDQQPSSLPTDRTNRFHDVAFRDPARGVVVGSSFPAGPTTAAFTIDTVDGGTSWQRVPKAATDGRLSSVCLTESGIGIAVGSGGFKSVNLIAHAFLSGPDGIGWEYIPVRLSDVGGSHLPGAFRGVACVGDRDLWVVGRDVCEPFCEERLQPLSLLHSDDGGATWENQSSRVSVGLVDASLEAISFVDADHGWAVGVVGEGQAGVPLVVHTSNGGARWDRQVLPGATMGVVDGVAFATATEGVVVGAAPNGAPRAFRTDDGGRHWTPLALPAELVEIADVAYGR